MPNYFADYRYNRHFISEEEMKRDHSGLPHGVVVSFVTGVTGMDNEHKHDRIQPKSRIPTEFTGSVIVAYAKSRLSA